MPTRANNRILNRGFIPTVPVMTTNPFDAGTANAKRLGLRIRNDSIFDIWSIAHLVWGIGLAMVFGPVWAVVFLVAWEPFEILLLGPYLARWGIPFGHETWRNSVSDILFDAAGAAIAFYGVLRFWDPLAVL